VYHTLIDRKQLIKEAFAKLNAIDYTILSLYYYEGLSLKEISKIVERKKKLFKSFTSESKVKIIQRTQYFIKKELKELI
jgi:DNA-directed RNA polymerase specialized sigma subunit